jgi:hypothetical protein
MKLHEHHIYLGSQVQWRVTEGGFVEAYEYFGELAVFGFRNAGAAREPAQRRDGMRRTE